MKKLMCLLTAVIMLASAVMSASAQSNATFEDVTNEHYAYDAVEYFYREKVIQGVGNNKFDPDAFITREQFAKMISIIYGKEESKPEGQTFSDVTPDRWSYTYIESVKEYLTGYYPEGGTAFFNPAAKATREDIAYALVKIGGLEKYKDLTVLDKYDDSVQISINLREYIAAAVNSGLMQGYENKLRPQDGCTRAEVATLLFRAIKKPVDTENTDIPVPEDTKDNQENNKCKIKTDDIIAISGYTEENIEGELVLEWTPGENTAQFDAKLKCNNGGLADYVICIISLEELIYVDEHEISGYFDFTMNEKLRHDNIQGKITIEDSVLKLNTEEYDYNLLAKFDDQDNLDETDQKENKTKDDKQEIPEEEKVIKASNILEFKIINTEGENIFVDDPERLNGSAKIIFGADGIKDTKLIAEIIVDGKDEYYIESFAIDRYDMTSQSVLLELNYKVYKNEKLIIEKGGHRLYVQKEDDEMTMNGRAHFVASDITWASGRLPAEPENQPWEVWADSSLISYRVYEGTEETGYINYVYKTASKISKFESDFTLNGNKYSVELVAEHSKNDKELTGTFNIICNDKPVVENIKGKLTGYNGKPGESAKLEFDGDFPAINLMIVEKSQ